MGISRGRNDQIARIFFKHMPHIEFYRPIIIKFNYGPLKFFDPLKWPLKTNSTLKAYNFLETKSFWASDHSNDSSHSFLQRQALSFLDYQGSFSRKNRKLKNTHFLRIFFQVFLKKREWKKIELGVVDGALRNRLSGRSPCMDASHKSYGFLKFFRRKI